MTASVAPAPSSSSSSSSTTPAFQVMTSERVPLRLPLAGIGERAIASSIDVIFIVLLLITLLFAYNLVRRGDLEQDVARATTTMLLVIGVLLLAGIVAFDVVADVFFAGRTPGKRLAGLRVVDARGRPPDLLTSLLRNLLRLVDMLPLGYGVGVVTMFFTGTRRLGDLVAGTVVVSERVRGRPIVHELVTAAGTTTATPPRLDDDDVVRLV
ncbi:MAG TPA: RDD family protein, partial [Myxococcota bacterium]